MMTRRQLVEKAMQGGLAAFAGGAGLLGAQESAIGGSGDRKSLNGSWLLKSTQDFGAEGEEISLPGYQPTGWMPAVVPDTVLGSYIRNGFYKDPYYDTYNKLANKNIPDAGTPGSVFSYSHWYRTRFRIDSVTPLETIWLNLDGVNFAADLFLNGHLIGSMRGAFKRGLFHITNRVRAGENVLAVKVHQVDMPCVPGGMNSAEFKKFGRNGPTMLTSIGYDFVPQDGIRDRNMGIFRDVYLTRTGPVAVRDPFLATSRVGRKAADLSFRTYLINSVNRRTHGTLKVRIHDAPPVAVPITLEPGETREIHLQPADHAGLHISNPRLWWPIDKGPQEFYEVSVTFTGDDGRVSDHVQLPCGIREIHTDLWHGQLRFWVNGKKLFLNGGNWVQDAMLRTTRKGYEFKIRQMAQAGMNMLRCWSGSGQEHDDFFEVCDRHGILTWVETGIIDQMERPADKDLFLTNWRDVILRVRKHTSLAYYCGCNEGVSGISELAHYTRIYDGTRGFMDSSQQFGQRGDPYGFSSIANLYDYTPVSWGVGPLGAMAGFCNESGQITTPAAEVLREMISEEKLWPVTNNRALDEVFTYHGNGYGPTRLIRDGCARYGSLQEPDLGGRTTVENYAFKGQMVGAMAFRALSETWKRHKWDEAEGRYSTGWLMWTANEAEPLTSSRLAAYTGEPNSALYYTAHGNKPLHVQYDYFYNDVSVVNDTYAVHSALQVMAEIRSVSWELLWRRSATVSLMEDSVLKRAIEVPAKDAVSGGDVHFIYVELRSASGQVLDSMVYWRARGDAKYGADGPFTALNTMPIVELAVTANRRPKGEKQMVAAKLQNRSPGIALFVRLKIYRKNSQRLLQPVYYSDNYFSVLPAQERTVTLEYEESDLSGERPQLIVEAWNLQTVRIDL
jgi:mannosylglycoprotein endo-beta-mannosidase